MSQWPKWFLYSHMASLIYVSAVSKSYQCSSVSLKEIAEDIISFCLVVLPCTTADTNVAASIWYDVTMMLSFLCNVTKNKVNDCSFNFISKKIIIYIYEYVCNVVTIAVPCAKLVLNVRRCGRSLVRNIFESIQIHKNKHWKINTLGLSWF